MKLQKPEWKKRAPEPLSDSAFWSLYSSAKTTAESARHRQDVLEDFKGRFTTGTIKRSANVHDAESDLYSLMRNASLNAPLCIAKYALACSDIREQGINAPDIRDINRTLHLAHTGYQIHEDTVVEDPTWHREAGPATKDLIFVAEANKDGGPILFFDFDKPAPKATIPAKIETQPSKAKVGRPMLKVFLCHSSGDKPAVKKLYDDLKDLGYDPWLDNVKLLPGQDWESEIKKAVKSAHVVLVCLSQSSVTKAGFVQKEIRFALDVADEQPEGRIYIIPVRLEDCSVPERLTKWHWVNLFDSDGAHRLKASLEMRSDEL